MAGKVRKERTEKDALSGSGGSGQHFVAERELLWSMGYLKGQQKERPLACSPTQLKMHQKYWSCKEREKLAVAEHQHKNVPVLK